MPFFEAKKHLKLAHAGMDSTPPLLIFSRSQPMESIVSSRHSRQNRSSIRQQSHKASLRISGRGARCSAGVALIPLRQKSQTLMNLSNVISMDDRISKSQSSRTGVRDRRYAIRFPFAADVELIDMESGTKAVGVTSDISLGGCFVCTSKPLPVTTRVRITLTRKGQKIEALAVVRILKPRIGMGIEFIDVEGAYHGLLNRWIDQIRQSR
jgi:hypothetical protein